MTTPKMKTASRHGSGKKSDLRSVSKLPHRAPFGKQDDRRDELLNAALDYARRGWPVFPCKPGEKKPATAHGFKDATTDEKKIRGWWSAKPCNIGVCMGPKSGIFVLDEDPRNGGDDSLEGLENDHGPLPDTLTSLTGGGGRHFIFRQPQNMKVKSGATVLGGGLDIKGDCGYIIAPPSLHKSGNFYEWEMTLETGEPSPVADAPRWLLDALKEKSRLHVVPPPGNGKARPMERAGVPAKDAPIPKGSRNNSLIRLAGTLRHAGASQAAIIAALGAENDARCRPPLTDSEVKKIAGSAARYVASKAYWPFASRELMDAKDVLRELEKCPFALNILANLNAQKRPPNWDESSIAWGYRSGPFFLHPMQTNRGLFTLLRLGIVTLVEPGIWNTEKNLRRQARYALSEKWRKYNPERPGWFLLDSFHVSARWKDFFDEDGRWKVSEREQRIAPDKPRKASL